MIDFFKNVRWSLLFIGVLTIVIGVAMVMYPDTASDTIVKIIGGIMAVSAIFSILGYLIDRARGRTAFTSLLVGALMLIMGAVLYFKPQTFIEFLEYIFAAVVLVQGINLIVEAFSSRKYESGHWGQTFLMGLICIMLAVIIFINPFAEFRALMILTGIALIVAGILNSFVSFRIGLAIHKYNMAVKAVESGMSSVANLSDNAALEDSQSLNDNAVLVEDLDSKEGEIITGDAVTKENVVSEIETEIQAQAEGVTRAKEREIPDKLSDIKLNLGE